MNTRALMLGIALTGSLLAVPSYATPSSPVLASYLLATAVGKPNPGKANFEFYYNKAVALGDIADTISSSAPLAHRQIRDANLTLKRGILAAAEANAEEDRSGDLWVDTDGFTRSFASWLRSEKSTCLLFAASGWGISERTASKQIDALAKAPSFPDVCDALLAILIGLVNEAEARGLSAETIDAQAAAAEVDSLGIEVHTISHK